MPSQDKKPLKLDAQNSKTLDPVSFLTEENNKLDREINKQAKELKDLDKQIKQRDQSITALLVQNKGLQKDVSFFRATNLCREIGAMVSAICGLVVPFLLVKWWDTPYLSEIYCIVATGAITSVMWGIYHGRLIYDV